MKNLFKWRVLKSYWVLLLTYAVVVSCTNNPEYSNPPEMNDSVCLIVRGEYSDPNDGSTILLRYDTSGNIISRTTDSLNAVDKFIYSNQKIELTRIDTIKDKILFRRIAELDENNKIVIETKFNSDLNYPDTAAVFHEYNDKGEVIHSGNSLFSAYEVNFAWENGNMVEETVKLGVPLGVTVVTKYYYDQTMESQLGDFWSLSNIFGKFSESFPIYGPNFPLIKNKNLVTKKIESTYLYGEPIDSKVQVDFIYERDTQNRIVKISENMTKSDINGEIIETKETKRTLDYMCGISSNSTN
ncbi:hypothetical protein [Sphingobacterium sp. NPDC055346]